MFDLNTWLIALAAALGFGLIGWVVSLLPLTRTPSSWQLAL